MVRRAMDQNLDAVAGGSNLGDVIFHVIEWAQRTGRLDELIDGRAPQSGPALAGFAASVGKR